MVRFSACVAYRRLGTRPGQRNWFLALVGADAGAGAANGKPQLVVFPPDAALVLQNGGPSAAVDGIEHAVGSEATFSTTLVPVAGVTGVPERCLRGSADTMLVVD